MQLHFSRAFAVFSILCIYAFLYVSYNTNYPQSVYNGDIANYGAAIIQMEDSSVYQRDPAFSDGVLTKIIWSSSYFYMRIFQTIRFFAGNDFYLQLTILNLIPALIALVTFLWFFQQLSTPFHLSLLLAVSFSIWLVLIRYQGIPSLYYYSVIPIFLGLLWQNWVVPYIHKRPFRLRKVFLIGLVIGASPSLINSVNGLAFSIFVACLSLILFLLKYLPFRVVSAQMMGLLLSLVFCSLVVGTGGSRIVLSNEAAQIYAATSPLLNADWKFHLLSFAIVILCGLLAFCKPNRSFKLLFLGATCLFIGSHLGSITLIIAVYVAARIWWQEDDPLDIGLLLALNTSIFIGPVLFRLIYWAWQLLHIHLLIFFAWQMGRFYFIGFFVVSCILLRMFLRLTAILPQRLSWFIGILYALFIPLQQIDNGINLGLMDGLFLALVVALILINGASFEFSFDRIQLLSKVLVSGIIALICVVIIQLSFFNSLRVTLVIITIVFFLLLLWMTASTFRARLLTIAWGLGLIAFSITLVIDNYLKYPALTARETGTIILEGSYQIAHNTTDHDFILLTNWIRNNTPKNSLHFAPLEANTFRYLSQRSHLAAWMDQLVAQVNPATDERNRQIYKDASQFYYTILDYIARYDVDFITIMSNQSDPLPSFFQNKWYFPMLVYDNATYKLYKVEKTTASPNTYLLGNKLITALQEYQLPSDISDMNHLFVPKDVSLLNLPGAADWLAAYLIRTGTPTEDAFLLNLLVQQVKPHHELEANRLEMWELTLMPKELKSQNINYIMLSRSWLQKRSTFDQTLLFNPLLYRHVTTIEDIFDDTYYLLEVVGNVSDTDIPSPSDQASNADVLQTDQPILIGSINRWRGGFAQNLFLPKSDVTYFIWGDQTGEAQSDIPPEAVNQFVDLVSDDSDFWYIDDPDTSIHTVSVISALQNLDYSVIKHQILTKPEFPGLAWTVYHFKQLPKNLVAFHPQYLDSITLISYEVHVIPTASQGCESIEVTTWWQVKSAPVNNLNMTVRAVDMGGNMLAQSDKPLLENPVILSNDTEYIFFNSSNINIPCETGEYTLSIGIYQYQNNQYSDLFTWETSSGDQVGKLLSLNDLR